MKMHQRWAAWLLALALIFAAEGCASPPRAGAAGNTGAGPWTGRLALQVEDNQSQSFSAAFELKGSAQVGELALFSPLGSTLAVLAWAPGSATLLSDGRTREFSSIDTLATTATGAAIPLATLFDWLRGINTSAAGWKADLSRLAQGQLHARRLEPPPQADLRVVLDR